WVMEQTLIFSSTIKTPMKVCVSLYKKDWEKTNLCEEYDDDTTIIPRSTYVIARRLPATRPGRGTAARYVSGKMPTAPNMHRSERPGNASKPVHKEEQPDGAASKPPVTGDTEADQIAAMFAASSDAWSKAQEQMAK